MPDAAFFTNDARVRKATGELRDHFSRYPLNVSDFRSRAADGHELQYVDVVMEGGGTLGVALLGYLHVLEQFGVRFLSIGGTSAGSIAAVLLAAAGTPDEPRVERLITMLGNMPLDTFLDGDAAERELLDDLRGDAGMLEIGWDWVRVRKDANRNLGLCPGKAFTAWVRQQLERQCNVTCSADLLGCMRRLPPSFERLANEYGGSAAKPGLEPADIEFCVVAADITTETRVLLPRMAGLYFADPQAVHPADFVRASMSIPFVFTPFRVKDLPWGGREPELGERWARMFGIGVQDLPRDWPPREVLFVDGGVMSNFPIDAFHAVGTVPACPTFGVKLERDNRDNRVNGLKDLALQIFNGARHTLDYDFVMRNPDYRHLVCFVDTGRIDWLDFAMGDDTKLDLFRRGAQAACAFLRGFDWPGYKKIRADLRKAV